MDIKDTLESDKTDEVLALVAVASTADGLAAVGEQALLKLRHGHDGTTVHLLEYADDGTLVGYANIDASNTNELGVELVVHPAYRHRRIGSRLLETLVTYGTEHSAKSIGIWAHGDHPSAIELAHKYHFHRGRILHQMRKSLTDEKPISLPDEIRIRTFVPGQDETKLLDVNNAAFAEHPDQGNWTVQDLAMRQRESWFDPAGLFLAERENELLGFHWTKIHKTRQKAIGEVYVLGVSPAAQGMKLGAALTTAGLNHLKQQGLSTVMLYVDDTNSAAMKLYAREGFTRWVTDVKYLRR